MDVINKKQIMDLDSSLSRRILDEREFKNATAKYLMLLSLWERNNGMIDNNGNGNPLAKSCSGFDLKHTYIVQSTDVTMLLEKCYSSICVSDSFSYIKI